MLKGGFVVEVQKFLEGGIPLYSKFVLPCDFMQPCMRVGAAWLSYVLEVVLDGIARLFYTDVASSPLLLYSPWGYPGPSQADVAVIVKTGTHLGFRFISLLPVLWICFSFFRSTLERLLFLTVSFAALAGWPPLLITLFFLAADTFADWPVSYYNFAQTSGFYDFGSRAFQYLLVLYIARREPKRLWEAAAIAGCGQLIFENLGLVTGTALCVATLLSREILPVARRVRMAFLRISVAGLASLLVVGILVFSIYKAAGGTIQTPLSGVWHVEEIFGSSTYYWETFTKYNFLWLNVTVANFITLMFYPVVFGSVLGIVSAAVNRHAGADERRQTRRDFIAGLAVVFGFLFSVLVGLFFFDFAAGLASAMGRQLAPAVVLVVIPAAKGTELLIGNVLARRRAAA